MFGRFSYQKYKSEPERAPLESNLIATNDSPFLGLAFNWTRTLGATTVNELLVGFTHVKFETIPVGLGRHRRRQRDDRHSGRAGDSRPERTSTSGDVGLRGRRRVASSTTSRPTSSTRSSRWFKGRHSMKFGGRWLYPGPGIRVLRQRRHPRATSTTPGPSPASRFCRLPSRPGVAEGSRRPGGTVHTSRPSRRHLRARMTSACATTSH